MEGVVHDRSRGLELVEQLEGLVEVALLRFDFGDGYRRLHGAVVLDAPRDYRTQGLDRLGGLSLIGKHRGLGQARLEGQITGSLGGLFKSLLGVLLTARLSLDLSNRNQCLDLVLPLRELLDAPVVIFLGLGQVLLVEVGGGQSKKESLKRLSGRTLGENRLELLHGIVILACLKGVCSLLE